MASPRTRGQDREAGDTDRTRTYATVIAVWVLVLAALFGLQQYFTF